ncbi:MAG: hypothetical protein AAFV98_01700 [Chloroflexota bacterium]
MKTSADAIKDLQEALAKAQEAQNTINNLTATHDYQDVTGMVVQAANGLLEAAIAFMQHDDSKALALVEAAEDLLDDMYDVIDGDLDL